MKLVLQIAAGIVLGVMILGFFSALATQAALNDLEANWKRTYPPPPKPRLASAQSVPQTKASVPPATTLADDVECRGDSPGRPGVAIRRTPQADGSMAISQVIENGLIVQCIGRNRVR